LIPKQYLTLNEYVEKEPLYELKGFMTDINISFFNNKEIFIGDEIKIVDIDYEKATIAVQGKSVYKIPRNLYKGLILKKL